jgi:hypothetical protein
MNYSTHCPTSATLTTFKSHSFDVKKHLQTYCFTLNNDFMI